MDERLKVGETGERISNQGKKNENRYVTFSQEHIKQIINNSDARYKENKEKQQKIKG